MTNANESDICCPRFDPAPWQDQEIVWQDKLFIKETMPQIWHMPLPGSFGRAVRRTWQKIDTAQARPDDASFLMLSAESSPWRGELYISATREVPDAENVRLSGTYLTKVYDGPFQDVPKWIREMAPYVAARGKSVKNYYFYYTTCPKCAKKYGHNYVVLFAELT